MHWKEELVKGAMFTLGAVTAMTAVSIVLSKFVGQGTQTTVKTSGAFPFVGALPAFPVVGATAIEHGGQQLRSRAYSAPVNWGAW